MNWTNYLLEKKSPIGYYAHLGCFDDEISAPFNLSELDANVCKINISTPLKKFKLNYSNWESLANNPNIEAITIQDLDQERLSVFATLPNLKYLQISINKQENLPNLSSLKNLEVLILANIMKVQNINFLDGLDSLKTLYIYGVKGMKDIEVISNLKSLQELSLNHGKLSGTGIPIRNIEPISKLTQLKYLDLIIDIKDSDTILPLFYPLKQLEHLILLPKHLKGIKKEEKETFLKAFPNLKESNF